MPDDSSVGNGREHGDERGEEGVVEVQGGGGAEHGPEDEDSVLAPAHHLHHQ
jgi:hypothetical protein